MLNRGFVVIAVLGLIAVACGGDGGSRVASVDDLGSSSTSTVASIEDDAGQDPPSGEPDDGTTDDGNGIVDTEQALLDLAACMRDEGIDMDDPQIDADGNVRLGAIIRQASDADPDDIRAAMEACSEYLEGVTLGFRDFDITEFQDQMLEFAGCMRDNGFDMPDPDFSNFLPRGGARGGGEPGGGPFGEIDPNDPGFQSALEACQDILSFGGFGGRIQGSN